MRQVPQDLTAEQSLLGAMLVDPNCIPEVIEQVRSDDFYADENKRIFEVIYSMFNGAKRIDPVTVLDELTSAGYYDEAGGRAYLFQLMDITPGSRNVTVIDENHTYHLYTSPSPRYRQKSLMPSSACKKK